MKNSQQRKYRLTRLRNELKETQKEIRELEKTAGKRLEVLRRHQRQILNLIGRVENFHG